MEERSGQSCDKIHVGQNACRKESETRDIQGNVGGILKPRLLQGKKKSQ
jgi:hypothetical protein